MARRRDAGPLGPAKLGKLLWLASVLALAWPGDLARAGEPAAPSPPPAAPLYPPWTQLDAQFADLTAQQKAYANKFDTPPWAEPDPWASRPCHVFAQGGFWMVHSYLGRNPTLISAQRQGAAANAPLAIQSPNFDYSVNFGPRLTLGVVTAGGLGLRSSWAHLDEGQIPPLTPGGNPARFTTAASVPVPGLPGFISPNATAQQLGIFNDRIQTDNRLRLDVWDFEAFRDFRGECWGLLVAGGARYGYLSQGYRAWRANNGTSRSGTTTTNLVADTDVIGTGRNFAGVGPTAAVELRRRFGETGFSVFGSARGSVLFGHERTRSFQQTTQTVQTTVGSAAPKTTTSSTLFQAGDSDATAVPLADFELGVDWTMRYGPARVFVQAGLVNQTWFSTGNATSAAGSVDFLGLRLTAGVNY